MRRGVLLGLVLVVGLALAHVTAASAAAEQLLVCNFFSDTVSRFDLATGQYLGTLQTGVGLDGPLAARLGPDGLLYVASEGSHSIQRYDPGSGAYIDDFVASGSGGLLQPTGMTWGPDGHLYVPSFGLHSVLKYDGQTGAPLGEFVAPFSGQLSGPDNGTTFGPDGHLWVPSYNSNRICRYDGQSGAFLNSFAVGRPRVMEFRDGVVYVTSESLDAVRRFNATTFASQGFFVASGAGGLDTPVGMVFAPDGVLYVTSATNDNILKYDGQTGAFLGEFAAAGVSGDGPVFLTVIPEPGTMALLVIAAAAWRRR
ncbi:Virginiamycin B lyase [Phycisphaerae bacterium RAS1]|nr:Virginiamycin B lyase [Phycisphaerae bacterium RAS1]